MNINATADKPENDIIDFSIDIHRAVKMTKKEEIIMTMGDFNAKVGEGRYSDIIGDFGLGIRNGDQPNHIIRNLINVILNIK